MNQDEDRDQNDGGARPLSCLSSMATRGVLQDLAAAYATSRGRPVHVRSVGGVDAERLVREGEPVDVALLAAAPTRRLMADGFLRAGSVRDVARSETVLAVRAHAALPDTGNEAALRGALLGSGRLAISTGPSGDAILALLERWGVRDVMAPKIVKAPPGVPVGALLAQGDAEIGFQQRSELMGIPGVAIAGALPPPIGITTTFSAGIAAASPDPAAASEWLDFLCSDEAAGAIRRNGMEPAG